MQKSKITYFGQKATVGCDANCAKAWGWASRPQENGEYLADQELGVAPVDPRTYEGGQRKPDSPSEFIKGQKWCVRQCERAAMTSPGKSNIDPVLLDWSLRHGAG